MDLQYYGGNCILLSGKGVRLVVDDYLANFSVKPIVKQGDIVLYTAVHEAPTATPSLLIDGPGEYEVSNLAIVGIPARGHMDDLGTQSLTIYRVVADDVSYLFTGNIYPELSDAQLEDVGRVDVMFVPVGGNGYTTDPTGALNLVKQIEPKIVIPTHYADPELRYPVIQQDLEQVMKNLGMEPIETVTKFRYKFSDNGNAQLIILKRA